MRWNNKYNVSRSKIRFSRLNCIKIKQRIQDPLLLKKRRIFFEQRRQLSEEYYSYEDNRGMLKRLRLEKDKQKRVLNKKVYVGSDIIYDKDDHPDNIKGWDVRPSRKDLDAVVMIGHSNRLRKTNRMRFHDNGCIPKQITGKGSNRGKSSICSMCHPKICNRMMRQYMIKNNLQYIQQHNLTLDEDTESIDL